MRFHNSHSKISLDYYEIPGLISSEALSDHFKLYEGYVDTLARVDQSLLACPRPDKPNPDHPFRALKEAESFAAGGVLLHEMYFKNLTPVPEAPPLPIASALNRKWGDIASWWQDMKATALVARGWAVLGMCEINPEDLRIFMLDSHNAGSLFGFTPLVSCDVYEHSYFLDHGPDKVSYLNLMPKFLRWSEINKRYLEGVSASEMRASSV